MPHILFQEEDAMKTTQEEITMLHRTLTDLLVKLEAFDGLACDLSASLPRLEECESLDRRTRLACTLEHAQNTLACMDDMLIRLADEISRAL